MINNRGGMLIRLVATYIGAVIGAGFASGQEILQFFVLYGYQGLAGVVVATVLFSYLGALILYLSVKLQAGSYQELLTYLLGPWAGKFMDYLSIIMLLGGLAVMLSGSGAVVNEYLGLPSWVGIGAALIVISLVLFNGVRGLLMANVILVPVKFAAVCLIAILAILLKGLPSEISVINHGGIAGNWLWSSMLYVSFNMIVPVAVLSSLGRSVTTRIGILGGLIGGVGLGFTALLVTLAGLSFYPEVANYEVPMLYMASGVNSGLRPVFALLIWLAILTTAIANAHGFASRLAPNGGNKYRMIGLLACLGVLPLTVFEFSSLVRVLYPLFGYAGLALLVAMLIIPLIKTKRKY